MSWVARARKRSAWRRILVAVPFVLIAVGCSVSRPPAKGPEPVPTKAPPRPKPGYEGRVDDLASIDPDAFKGRRIALDPGHGGFFRGALGTGGLTEAEVNLGVALDLRGLLEARGATVLMTRTDDRDYLTPEDSTLRSDLAERSRLANAFHPDLFVSIHHNADARGAHDINETQTYYKLGDEGPSLDAAEDVHRYLVRNLGIENQRIMPGNYFVLRNSVAPALLTESSYITNPDVESKLALASKQRLEAEALLLGLGRYFARARPEITELVAFSGEHPARTPDTLTTWAAAPTVEATIRGPYDHLEVSLDQAPQPVRYRPGAARVRWSPEDGPLAPGDHVVSFTPRLAGAGTARTRDIVIRVERPARAIRVSPFPRLAPPEGGVIGCHLELIDDYGLTTPDSIALRVRADCACDSVMTRTVTTRAGAGWAYLDVAPLARRPRKQAGQIGLVVESAGPVKLSPARVSILYGEPGTRTAFLRRMPGDTLLVGAPGSGGYPAPPLWVNAEGLAVAPAGDPPTLAGYRAWQEDTSFTTLPRKWTAIAGGALHGRRVVIDPDGGGEQSGGSGKSDSAPAVPSGACSHRYSIRQPNRRPSPKWSWITSAR
jgi:N-acetylmuramoyl-L-alanine amidase